MDTVKAMAQQLEAFVDQETAQTAARATLKLDHERTAEERAAITKVFSAMTGD